MLKSEYETTINIYGDESTARIYTCDPRYIHKLEKLINNNPDTCRKIKDSPPGSFFEIPASFIKFHPKRKISMSDDRKNAIAERLKQYRKEKAEA